MGQGQLRRLLEGRRVSLWRLGGVASLQPPPEGLIALNSQVHVMNRNWTLNETGSIYLGSDSLDQSSLITYSLNKREGHFSAITWHKTLSDGAALCRMSPKRSGQKLSVREVAGLLLLSPTSL